MKNRVVLTLVIVLFSLNALFCQEVPEVQKSLITKITATWCPNCGGWGWPFFKNIYNDNKDKALVIAAHHSGQLQTMVATNFALNFNVNYQPYFILGNENQNVTSGNTATKRTDIKNMVDANYLLAPVANAGLAVSKDGNMLHVQTKTRFFQNAEGDYYLGVYVVEDGVINFQQGQGDEAIHTNVLRAVMGGSSFGVQIASGSIAYGSEFEQEFSIQLNGSWNPEKLEIATIIWKKEGNTYYFVNTHSTTDFSTVGVSTIDNDAIGFRVFPNFILYNATIELDIKEENRPISLVLTDASGKKIKTIFEGRAVSGLQTYTIDRSMVNTSGLYFIVLQTENGVSTKKIVFQ